MPNVSKVFSILNSKFSTTNMVVKIIFFKKLNIDIHKLNMARLAKSYGPTFAK